MKGETAHQGREEGVGHLSRPFTLALEGICNFSVYTYHPNRSTDDAISIVLHTALSHLDKRNTYVRMLFIDYSAVFNTIVPSKLITKLRTL